MVVVVGDESSIVFVLVESSVSRLVAYRCAVAEDTYGGFFVVIFDVFI